jgi:hypothetical protein
MRFQVSKWLKQQDPDAVLTGNGLTLIQNLIIHGSDAFFDNITSNSTLMEILVDQLWLDLSDAQYFARFLANTFTAQDDPVRAELLTLKRQEPPAADEMLRVMLRAEHRCPSRMVSLAIWDYFVGESITNQGEWNESLCLVAAAAVLKRPIHVVKVRLVQNMCMCVT